MEAPQIRRTEDGSPTLYNPSIGEHYHSIHGAVQESRHIFVEAALRHRLTRPLYEDKLNILELGFGTGLNALMTLEVALGEGLRVHYTSLELYPVPESVYRSLDFPLELKESKAYLERLHDAKWNEPQAIEGAENFVLEKRLIDMLCYDPSQVFDVVYFDAFSPESQGELWSEEFFRRLYEASRSGTVLTTYCAKGEVRRRLQRSGWLVERLPGPPGKREILRATKDWHNI